MAKLSIIVPIYNVEKYLKRCIDSILAQTYADFELILINDGSTDNCAEIMEQYAKEDDRIISVHQANKGVSAARNAGLRIATGEYIGFVDPDDWIEKEMYQAMIRELSESESDLVCCNWDIYDENMRLREHVVNNILSPMCKEAFVLHLFDLPRTVGGTIWNKLFLRKKVESYFDENIIIGEDAIFTIKYCQNIEKISYMNKSFYNCFERGTSATRHNKEKVAMILDVKRQMIEIAQNVSQKAKMQAERDYLDSCLLYYKKFIDNPESKYFKQGKLQLHKYMRSNWCKVLSNNEIYWKTRMIYIWYVLKR